MHKTILLFTLLLCGCSLYSAPQTGINEYERRKAPEIGDPTTWNTDFSRGPVATDECEFDSILDLRKRIYVSDPYTIKEYEETVSIISYGVDGSESKTYNAVADNVKQAFVNGWSIHKFAFRSDMNVPDWWGYSGYLVADGECVIFAETTFFEHG